MSRVLVVGGGGREHALAWSLSRSPLVHGVVVAPGNGGTSGAFQNLDVEATDVSGLVQFVESQDIDLTVIGPEVALEVGVQSALAERGHRVVGPEKYCFQLEASKSFAKEMMVKAGVPTAASRSFHSFEAASRYASEVGPPLVVKADGLAAGKGVAVCRTGDEALAALCESLVDGRFGVAGSVVLVEELLAGPEVSLMCLVDGDRAVPLPMARDHKRLLDGDHGANTGGMGAYAPVRLAPGARVDELVETTVMPVVDQMRRNGHPYRGVLFAGLMLTKHGPRVLEYNCRFGDPETQAVLPLLDDDLFDLLSRTADGSLPDSIRSNALFAAAVVLAAPGYPQAPAVGMTIGGLDHDRHARSDVRRLIFHAATQKDETGRLRTSGGRVMSVVGVGPTLRQAMRAAYSSPVHFEGMQFRRDIGQAALGGEEVQAVGLPETDDGDRGLPGRPRLVVMASGQGSNLQALIAAEKAGQLDAHVCGVISHEVAAGALGIAREAQIPHAFVPIRDRRSPESRREHEQALLETVRNYHPDLVVLAGWMLVLSSPLIDELSIPIINVHPSLLPVEGEPLDIPVLRGNRAVRDAVKLRLPYTGVSIHHVVADVDAGPVIAREALMILPDDDEKSLHARLKLVEHRLLVDAVNQLAVNLGGFRSSTFRHLLTSQTT